MLKFCLTERCLMRANIFQAARGYRHVLGRKMRFNGLLLGNISKYFSPSAHKFTTDVFNNGKISRLANRKLLFKVSTAMHDDINEFFDEEKDDFDTSLVLKQFPSIIVGQSSPVELYNEISDLEKSSEIIYNPNGTKLVNPDSVGTIANDFNQFSSHKTETISDQENLIENSSSLKEEKSQNKQKLDLKRIALQDQPNNAPFEFILDKSISCIPTLSKKQCTQLENCGLYTIRKLLSHFPRTYADLQNAQFTINDGQYLIFIGKVLSSRGIKANCSLSFLEIIVGCEVTESGSASACSISEQNNGSKRRIYLHLKKFFRGTRYTYQGFLKSLEQKQKEGDIVCVSGKVRSMRTKNHYEIREYSLDLIRDDDDVSACAEGRPYPIYPSKGGLNPKLIGDIIARVVNSLPADIDPIPKNILQMFGLKSLRDTYIGIHRPANFNEADLARKRIIFDEFFYLQLARLFQMLEGVGTYIEKDGLLDKYRNPATNSVLAEEWCTLTKKFLKILPYSLTSSQFSAVSEIIWDLKRKVPMNRLLQGDVGCGKTVVAFLACMEVIGSGYQAAFMVPTELLAIQHHDHLINLLENMEDEDCKPSVALLTGSTPAKKARQIREGLQSGEIALVIGTHSLIAEKVEFSSLRIAVVDEQHRFGVIQRGRFNSKLYTNSKLGEIDSSKSDINMAPHVLAMTATPIPRTLALALYGDMSLTQITDLPPGRLPIDTYTVEGNETGFEEVYKMMKGEVESGGRVYIVYPIIEQSEQLPQVRGANADLEVISNRFPGINCGLLHGKMKADEKEESLKLFRSGETQILLSTLVIEIGVDVPEASMMVVMNAERFGLAQLHQLRGRVGRGARKSKCVLLSSTASGLGRLEMLQKSSDGFHLANMDLLLRGPGDLLGRKQSGHLPEFPVARLEVDGNILQDAHLAALTVLSESHNLEEFPGLKGELSMRQPLCLLGD